jgi:hypothetical protein
MVQILNIDVHVAGIIFGTLLTPCLVLAFSFSVLHIKEKNRRDHCL